MGDPANALGKRLRFGKLGPWNEVVGVAGNVHADGVYRPVPATVYHHIGGGRAMTFAEPSDQFPYTGGVWQQSFYKRGSVLQIISETIHGERGPILRALMRKIYM